MALNYFLDTNIILYLLGGRLAESLPNGQYFTSIIVEMELRSYPSLTEQDEGHILNFLKDITVVDLTEEVKEEAIRIRRLNSTKLPDAIIVATAQILNAKLLSNDIQLSKILGINLQNVRLVE